MSIYSSLVISLYFTYPRMINCLITLDTQLVPCTYLYCLRRIRRVRRSVVAPEVHARDIRDWCLCIIIVCAAHVNPLGCNLTIDYEWRECVYVGEVERREEEIMMWGNKSAYSEPEPAPSVRWVRLWELWLVSFFRRWGLVCSISGLVNTTPFIPYVPMVAAPPRQVHSSQNGSCRTSLHRLLHFFGTHLSHTLDQKHHGAYQI